ncbi:hypothetical protein D9V41_08130 [Aeromicrobium phragmitis]|uniref:Uncharacterized protein n=1 Tax=Aeromicrobium phragmitis TaxID=2478914 RepID=A0A3L8PKH7_9ACTN|nr:hypothetical protein [Aeromicrobium phragmitis]RLV55867.1 hypothetical protein D9V41_08130 [Aeromicrobium phragmitis]
MTEFADRAALLRERQQRLDVLFATRDRWRSLLADAAVLVLGFVAVVAVGSESIAAAGYVLAALMIAGLVWRWIRWSQTRRKVAGPIRYWTFIDRAVWARHLGGEVPDRLVTAHEVARSDDFDRLAPRAVALGYGNVWHPRVLIASCAVGALFAVTVPGIIIVLLDDLDAAARAVAVVVVVGSVGLAGARLVGLVRDVWLQQQVLDLTRLELRTIARWRGVREPSSGLGWRLVPLALVLVSLLVTRVISDGWQPFLVAVLVVLLLALACVPALLLQRRSHIVSLRSYGDALLDRPNRRVAVDTSGDAVVLRNPSSSEALRLDPDQISGALDVPLGWPLAPPATALVLADGDIVIVAGEAARPLRERFADRAPVQD